MNADNIIMGRNQPNITLTNLTHGDLKSVIISKNKKERNNGASFRSKPSFFTLNSLTFLGE